jgi:hypothetical protein
MNFGEPSSPFYNVPQKRRGMDYLVRGREGGPSTPLCIGFSIYGFLHLHSAFDLPSTLQKSSAFELRHLSSVKHSFFLP